ncbi:hypothetical protein F1880_009377 [Penicillium rolfsii]|nr:hypothetical protein F1880_009377 [Penicillium rolfsii]
MGGQLCQHFALQSILSEEEQQDFARLRLQASERLSRQPSTFRGVPDPKNGGDHRLDTDATCRGGQMMGGEAQNQLTLEPFTGFSTTSPRLPSLAGSLSADSTGRLDTLKRRLLQDPDWAAVSAARPLEFAFTPAQEAEHFGKRRRLTETERKHLLGTHGNHTTLAFPKPYSWKGRDNPLVQNQIKITSQPVSQQPQRSQGIHTPLDKYTNQDFSCSQSPKLSWPRLSAYAQHSAHLSLDLSPLEAPFSAGSRIQHTRQFTIEDKVLGDKPDRGPRFLPSYQLQQEPSRSPAETLPASPTLVATDSLSTTGIQSWLPQSTRPAFPSSPIFPRSQAVNPPVGAFYLPSYNQESSDPFTCCVTEAPSAAPVKIYGQLFRLRSTDDEVSVNRDTSFGI